MSLHFTVIRHAVEDGLKVCDVLTAWVKYKAVHSLYGGKTFYGFVTSECKPMGLTHEQIELASRVSDDLGYVVTLSIQEADPSKVTLDSFINLIDNERIISFEGKYDGAFKYTTRRMSLGELREFFRILDTQIVNYSPPTLEEIRNLLQVVKLRVDRVSSSDRIKSEAMIRHLTNSLKEANKLCSVA